MMSKTDGISYACELCGGKGFVVYKEPTKEPDVLPITEKMKKKPKVVEPVVARDSAEAAE